MAEKDQELVVSYEVDGNKIKLTPSIVQNYIVGSDSKITRSEFKMFTELCKVRKLNPFLKEAYCIKYGNQPATIVVGKDVIVKRAIAHPQYNGKETGVIIRTSEGEVLNRQGCFVAPDEILLGGWARVYRRDWDYPEFMSVSLDEVKGKKRDGSVNSTWQGKAATMVEKVAKVRAMREAFNDELGGMYDETEFNQGNETDQGEPEIVSYQDAESDNEAPRVNMDEL